MQFRESEIYVNEPVLVPATYTFSKSYIIGRLQLKASDFVCLEEFLSETFDGMSLIF